MTTTQLLAGWGAIVSTLVAMWNFYKDVIKRERVGVSGGFRIMFSDETDKQDVFIVTATNHGDKLVSVTHIGIYPTWEHRWHRVAKLLRREAKTSSFLLSFNPMDSPLPRKIEPRHHEDMIYTITREKFPPIRHLFVITADGRQWFMAKRYVDEIRREISQALEA